MLPVKALPAHADTCAMVMEGDAPTAELISQMPGNFGPPPCAPCGMLVFWGCDAGSRCVVLLWSPRHIRADDPHNPPPTQHPSQGPKRLRRPRASRQLQGLSRAKRMWRPIHSRLRRQPLPDRSRCVLSRLATAPSTLSIRLARRYHRGAGGRGRCCPPDLRAPTFHPFRFSVERPSVAISPYCDATHVRHVRRIDTHTHTHTQRPQPWISTH